MFMFMGGIDTGTCCCEGGGGPLSPPGIGTMDAFFFPGRGPERGEGLGGARGLGGGTGRKGPPRKCHRYPPFFTGFIFLRSDRCGSVFSFGGSVYSFGRLVKV